MDRFEGIVRLYGDAGVQRLAAARVLVVGLGGVGSWAVEALARSGVGALTLMDGDEVCVSNTNRQIHALEGTVGRPKVAVLAERVGGINPACRVDCLPAFFVRTEAEKPFAEKPDYVIDCVDGVTAKASLIGTAHRLGIPVISCGAAGGKMDPTRVRVADLAEAYNDRLLMFTRKLLRKHHGFPKRGNRKFGVPCVFSPEPVTVSCIAEAGAAAADDPFAVGEGRLNCDGRLGAVTFVTGVFGFMAAARVVNDLVRAPARKSA